MSSAVPPHDGPTPAAGFQQRLGLFDATMLVVGTMIGSGIFVTSAAIAQDVGSAGWLLVVWGLAGVMTIIGALSYAELAAMMPRAGGQYVYLREQYNPLCGFLYGWTCFLVIQTGSIAAVGVAFAKFLGVMAPALGVAVQFGEPDQVQHVSAFMPDLADLGTDAVKQPAIIIFAHTHLNLKLTLPFMSEPFFKLEHFTVTAGQLVAVAIIVFLTLLNCRGVQEGKIVQNVFTVSKTLALIVLILVGLLVVSSPESWQINTTDWWGAIYSTGAYKDLSRDWGAAGMLAALMVMGGAMVGSLFSADAWNNITFTAGEIRNPRRNLPLSLALGTGSVILLYMLANLAYVRSLPVQGDLKKAETSEAAAVAALRRADELALTGQTAAAQQSRDEAQEFRRAAAFERGIDKAKDERVATAVMERWSPGMGAYLMAAAIMISTFGCINGMILMGARLYYVMAQDNLFFGAVGSLNSRGVPAVGLILQGIWSVLLVFSGTYNELLDYVIFAVLVFYVLTVTGLFILRRTQPDAERPYKAWGYPVLPALYVFLCAAIMLDLLIVKPKYTWPGLIIVLSGIPVYFLWRAMGRPPEPQSQAEPPA